MEFAMVLRLFQNTFIPFFITNLPAILLFLEKAGKARRMIKRMCIILIIRQINNSQIDRHMRFKQDCIQDFINYKLNNPQALQEEMRMIKDRQDYTKKLNDYAKSMQNLKNQYNMYKQLYDASLAKKAYLQQTYQENQSDINDKIAQCKEEIQLNNREIKQREMKNEMNRKKYNDFQKQIALKKDKLTGYHLNELSSLFNKSQLLKKELQEKRQRKIKMQEELRILKDREKIIQDTVDNLGTIKNKWMVRKRQLQKYKEEQMKKQKQIRDQINNAISMEKVIYGNFYKRCAQMTSQMRDGLEKLFDRNFANIEGSNLQQKLEKMLQLLKTNRQYLLSFINEKRQKYKIGPLLPQADAQVYNNIVQTKINAELLTTINKTQYRNNDYLLKEIQDGLTSMFEKLQIEKRQALQRENTKASEIRELNQKIQQFQIQIQTKKKQLLSPSKRSRKN